MEEEKKLEEISLISNGDLKPEDCLMLKQIFSHYRHAVEKHPWFCDDVCDIDYSWASMARSLKDYISYQAKLHDDKDKSYCLAKDVLNAEMAEIFAAYSRGDFAQARYEIFDAIAVLLRMDDMIAEKQMEDGKC